MDRSLVTRGVVIIGVIALFGFAAYPPREKINLGLDLRGGMHLVLRVKTEDAVRDVGVKDTDRLVQELADLGIAGTEVTRRDDTTFAVTGIPAERDAEVEKEVVQTHLPGWRYERSGDEVLLGMTAENVKEIRELAVNQSMEIIRNRIDAFGVTEPVIHREGIGGDRIVIQLPGVDDPQRVKDLIKNTAFLELRLVAADTSSAASREALVQALGGQVPKGVEIMPEEVRNPDTKEVTGQRFWALEARSVITGRDLKTARVSSGKFGEPVVLFLLTGDGATKFGEVTGANIGRQLAIVLDNRVQSVATIQARITDQGIIEGRFTYQEVEDLVTVLRSGALQAGLTYLEERTVGPSLGRDSIEKGEWAGLVGLVLVVLTMLVVYKLAGVNAVAALALNIVLVFGALSLFKATLTLPGIAGIILTIGMAVDANVLIFERIREELRAGRTVKSAIASGFSKAMSSIVDANITTLIAAMFLFTFGTGPVRGFAVTLSVGILASLFTAVFVSRWLFDLTLSRRQRVEKLSI